MEVDTLKSVLEDRGYDPSSRIATSIDGLLPPQPETEAAWLIRRAATEVSFDSGLKFIRYEGVVLPEPEPGQPPASGLLALSAIKDLLPENPTDPLQARLAEVERRGRSGALVTRLQMQPDFSSVEAEMVLLVRQSRGRWLISGSRSARVRPEELGPLDVNGLADDPQVALALRIVEAIGLGEVSPDLKRRARTLGAAAQRALGRVRTAAQADLTGLALPISDAPAPAP